MFSNEARKDVECAVIAELNNATSAYGKMYNSLHEGYAVLLEEVEEAQDNLKYIQNNLAVLWQNIKNNECDDTSLLTVISGTAQMLALESVQISAVCEKFKRGLK